MTTAGDRSVLARNSSARPSTAQGREPIRLGIVDDDPMVRTGLRLLFGGSADIAVVGEATDGAEAVAMVDAHRLDVVLMDIRMPRVDGLAATQQIRGRAGAPEVIVLTTFGADEYVVAALRGGAAGFLLKDTPPLDVIDAVRKVAAGDGAVSPGLLRAIIDHVADPAAGSRRARAQARLAGLTEREREVALGLGRGWSNAEIGAELRVGVPTVKGHVSRLLAKLEQNNRVQVAILVHDAEWL
jgi:DNA-binding NarL/FixJ family response regulator